MFISYSSQIQTLFHVTVQWKFLVLIMAEEDRYYNATVVWDYNGGSAVLVEDKKPIEASRPSAFKNQPNLHNPEELFVASAALCFMNSFAVFTKKMHIEFESFDVEATGRLEKVGRSFEITKIDMKSTVVISDENLRKKIERALELGDKYCFVANSMKCPREHEHEIVVE